MLQENYWDKQKIEISRILTRVFLKDSNAEEFGFKPDSESEKAILSEMAKLGIVLEPGSESGKAIMLYWAGRKKKYAKYQDRISFWVHSFCLGDTICSTPTLKKIKELFPNMPIDVYSYYPDIFRYNKYADRVFEYDPKNEDNGYYNDLRLFGYDQYFLTCYNSKVKAGMDLNITNLIDFCSLNALNLKLENHAKMLEVPVSIYEQHLLLDKISPYGINFDRAVIIHPSKTWETRTWAKENWQELTHRLIKNGFHVITVGKTAPVSEERKKSKGNEDYGMQPCPEGAINLIDNLSILETVYLLSLCKYAITMDSGLLHMALCTDITIIAMFTVIDPDFRKAWRKGSFDYKLIVVPPNGDCYYCSNLKSDMVDKSQGYRQCPLGKNVQCAPTVESVFKKVVDR
jgi:ADP-heptose:LPS heptosyltransferase